MKKWIDASTESNSIIAAIDKIASVIIVDDARSATLNGLPIAASSNDYYLKDFDQFTPEEMMKLTDKELRALKTPYALDALCQATNDYGFKFKLSNKQKEILHEFYKDRQNSYVGLTKEDFEKVQKLSGRV